MEAAVMEDRFSGRRRSPQQPESLAAAGDDDLSVPSLTERVIVTR